MAKPFFLLFLRATKPRRSFLFGILFSLLIIYPIFIRFPAIKRMVDSHSFDLDHETLYEKQFAIYILTNSCRRLTPDIAAAFDNKHANVILVPDVQDSTACAALGHEQLWLEPWQGRDSDETYLVKYAQVLHHCGQGQKMKCLILEDDVVLIHTPSRTKEVLVENTLTLFNHEENAYDCTKRGFGWVPSKHTGNGSQCRIYSKPSTDCMGYCLMHYDHEQLDYALRDCQNWCGISQRRFLMVQHSGLTSTMERSATHGQAKAAG
jgi:hypothetical protein